MAPLSIPLTLAVVFLCAACVVQPAVQPSVGATASPNTTDESGLDGTKWRLAMLDNQAVLPEPVLTLTFAQGHLSGHSGCNDYSGSYGATANKLTIDETVMTTMACVDEQRMTQEAKYMEALGQVAGFEMTTEELRLLNTQGDAILVYDTN